MMPLWRAFGNGEATSFGPDTDWKSGRGAGQAHSEKRPRFVNHDCAGPTRVSATPTNVINRARTSLSNVFLKGPSALLRAG